jgi:hypothetical protein
MASDIKATSHKEDLPEKETPESAPDGPLPARNQSDRRRCSGKSSLS